MIWTEQLVDTAVCTHGWCFILLEVLDDAFGQLQLWEAAVRV